MFGFYLLEYTVWYVRVSVQMLLSISVHLTMEPKQKRKALIPKLGDKMCPFGPNIFFVLILFFILICTSGT